MIDCGIVCWHGNIEGFLDVFLYKCLNSGPDQLILEISGTFAFLDVTLDFFAIASFPAIAHFRIRHTKQHGLNVTIVAFGHAVICRV